MLVMVTTNVLLILKLIKSWISSFINFIAH